MNSAILQRLIWKEYRVLRSFWLATVLMAPCLAIVCRAVANWYERELQVEDFFALTAIITSLFALGAGGTAFSTEHEIGTAEFLRRLPLDSRHLWCGKLALAFVGLMALKAVLWTGASILLLVAPAHGDQLRTIWWCSWVSELELFAWGALMSLLTRQPLMAITWAISAQSAIIHLVLPFIWWDENHWDLQSHRAGLLTDYDFALPGRTLFALGLLALSAVLSAKWLSSPQPLSLLPEWWRQRSLRRRSDQQSWLVAPATKRARANSSTANVQLTRLMWLQWRQSRWLWGSLAIPFVGSGAWLMALQPRSSHQTDTIAFLFAISTGLLWLGLGVSVFHGQQAQFRFRYFAEHGVSPARVWWGHQLAPLVLLVASAALIVIGAAIKRPLPVPRTMAFVVWFGGYLLMASVVFSVGQLAGMLCRQILIAAAMGCIGLLINGLWFFLLGMAAISPDSDFWPVVLGIGPLPLAWWLISRRHVNHWILERRTWATRCRLGLSLAAPWLLMLSGLAAYRVLEVPNVGVEPPTRRQLVTLSEEEQTTAKMYLDVERSLGIPTDWQTYGSTTSGATQGIIEARLRESPQTLDNLLQATQRPVGAFAGDPPAQNATAFVLAWVLESTRKQAANAGSLERSIELLDAQRRLIRHWRRNTDFTGLTTCNDHEAQLVQSLFQQLKAAALRADQYRELAGSVAEWAERERQTDRALEWAYRDALDNLQRRRTDDQRWSGGPSGRTPAPSPWLLAIPGEQARAIRLLNANFAVRRSSATHGQGVTAQGIHHLRGNTPWVRTFLYEIEHQSIGLGHARPSRDWQILRVWLEVVARQAELGHWPDTADGIPGLGPIKTENQYLVETLQYLPQGLWGGRAPAPLVVRQFGARRVAHLIGDEPCLVIMPRIKTPNLPADLVNAPAESDREELLRGLTVIPFVTPASSEQEE